VSLAADAKGAAVEVSDTGPGPPPELTARLYEPFVTGKPEGIGLGLAVAKQAADAHGAALAWRRDGGRTVFRAAFPP
jgi:nitrogen-specific signal transduction histidine kinase